MVSHVKILLTSANAHKEGLSCFSQCYHGQLHLTDQHGFLLQEFVTFKNSSAPILYCSTTAYIEYGIRARGNSNVWAETDMQCCITILNDGCYNIAQYWQFAIFIFQYCDPSHKLSFALILSERKPTCYVSKILFIDNQDMNLYTFAHIKVFSDSLQLRTRIDYISTSNVLQRQTCLILQQYTFNTICDKSSQCKEQSISGCKVPIYTISEITLTDDMDSNTLDPLSILMYYAFSNDQSVDSIANTINRKVKVFSEESCILPYKEYLKDTSFINEHQCVFALHHRVLVVRNISTSRSEDSLHAVVCRNFCFQEFNMLVRGQNSICTILDDDDESNHSEKITKATRNQGGCIYLWLLPSLCALFVGVMHIGVIYPLSPNGKMFNF